MFLQSFCDEYSLPLSLCTTYCLVCLALARPAHPEVYRQVWQRGQDPGLNLAEVVAPGEVFYRREQPFPFQRWGIREGNGSCRPRQLRAWQLCRMAETKRLMQQIRKSRFITPSPHRESDKRAVFMLWIGGSRLYSSQVAAGGSVSVLIEENES